MTYTKNILILALVAINLFFLAFVGLGLYRENAVKKQMYQELYILMEQYGILLDTEGINEDGELYRLETSRDPALEEALATALLGETSAVDRGVNITAYVGEAGEAIFYTGGEFDITFNEGVFKAVDSPEGTTKKILGTMAVETDGIRTEQKDGQEIATAVCTWSNNRIFNCRIQFVYENGSLLQISGKHPAIIRPTSDKSEMSTTSVATALLYFLRTVRDGKYDCGAIMDVSPGYRFIAAVYGDGSLRPVWRIAADSGFYLVDAETGAVQIE